MERSSFASIAALIAIGLAYEYGIEFDKIRNWLLFCARFVDFSKREKLDRGGERALEKFLDRGLADFYKQRKQKFGRR